MKNLVSNARAIIYWGAIWGILEATVGYILHLPVISIGWLVWTPLAAWCIARAYRDTNSRAAVLCVSLITCALKLTNLALPARIDMVINPAVSVVLEGLGFVCAFTVFKGIPKRATRVFLFALGANTLWRGMYALYACVLPAWMRDISVISSSHKLVRHMVIENIATTGIMFVILLILRRIKTAESPLSRRMPTGALAALCSMCVFLQFAL